MGVDDFNGWCGRQYCMNAKDRCLKVGIKKESIEHARKGQCPSSCDDRCQKSTFRMECIYTGAEPKWGTEGKAVPTAGFGESEPYEVFSLASFPLPPSWLVT